MQYVVFHIATVLSRTLFSSHFTCCLPLHSLSSTMSSSRQTPLLADPSTPATSSDAAPYSLSSEDDVTTGKSSGHLSWSWRVLISAGLLASTIALCAALGIYLLVARVPSAPTPDPNPAPPYPAANITCAPSLSPASCLHLYLAAYNLTAYVVPSNDAHNSEYVAAPDQRRQFISNFTGSAGTALVVNHPPLLNRLFTDSRYELQAPLELNPSEWTWSASGTGGLLPWVTANLPRGSTVGIDPSLISAASFASQAAQYAAAGIAFVPVLDNLVDRVWGAARPQAGQEPLFPLWANVTGETPGSKVTRIRALMQPQRCAAMVVTALDDIAWATNLRGRDIDDTPVFLSYLVISLTAMTLYVDLNKTVNVLDYAKEHGITLRPYTALVSDLVTLNATLSPTSRVWLSSPTQAILGAFTAANVYTAASPLIYMKAQKNPVELAAMKHAHKKDSAAFVIFFDWLERFLAAGNALDECEAASKIEEIRRQMPNFLELSYPTIAGSGPNGAIIHYFPKPPTCAQVTTQLMFLVDSGGQWLDCSTTDTTRTIHIGLATGLGNATVLERHAFTRVLQGHIDQMAMVWANGQTPADWPARQPLLRDGLTYGHGTSHGVGLMLNVHEGVGGAYTNGVITSIEPGYPRTAHRHLSATPRCLLALRYSPCAAMCSLSSATTTLHATTAAWRPSGPAGVGASECASRRTRWWWSTRRL